LRYFLLAAAGSVAVVLLGWAGCANAPSTGAEIQRIATLRTPRAAHTTTALSDGQLLIAGGMGAGGGSLASTERLDAATGEITSGASLNEPRVSHTATRLPDGRIVLAGGYNGSYLASVETFDPASGAFGNGGRLVEGRSGHIATLLPDGRILLAGGVGRDWTFLSSAEVFDPSTGRSAAVGSMSLARESHTATLLEDGSVLIVGGHRDRREAMVVHASAEIFDPEAESFRPAGELQTARHKHDAIRLADGRVLVLGGADRTDRLYYATTEIYDPARGTFAPGPTMRNTRYKIAGTAVLLADGSVLVPTGARTAEVLDAEIFTFREISGSFPDAYHFATATPLASGDVAIVGGYKFGNENTNGIWRFRASSPRARPGGEASGGQGKP